MDHHAHHMHGSGDMVSTMLPQQDNIMPVDDHSGHGDHSDQSDDSSHGSHMMMMYVSIFCSSLLLFFRYERPRRSELSKKQFGDYGFSKLYYYVHICFFKTRGSGVFVCIICGFMVAITYVGICSYQYLFRIFSLR